MFFSFFSWFDFMAINTKYRYGIIYQLINYVIYILFAFNILIAYIVIGFKQLGPEYITATVVYFQILLGSFLITFIIFKKYQKTTITLTDEKLKISKIFATKRNISTSTIKNFQIKKTRTIFSFLTGGMIKPLEKLVFYTIDKTYTVTLSFYPKKAELIADLQDLLVERDEYIFHYFDKRASLDFYKILKHPTGLIGLILVSFVIIIYIWGAFAVYFFPPSVADKYGYLSLSNPEYGHGFDDENLKDAPPSQTYLLGTDFVGRDYFSRIVYGTFYTLNMVLIITLISFIFAITIGVIAGLSSPKVDNTLVNIMDSLIAIPTMVFWTFGLVYSGGLRAIEGNKIEGGFFWNILIMTAIFVWAGSAKIIRNEIMFIRSKEYMHAQKIFGAGLFHQVRKHILPAITPVLLTILIQFFVDFITLTIAIGIMIPTDGTLIWGADISRRMLINYYPKQSLSDTYLLFSTFIFTATIFGFLLLSTAIKDITRR